MAQEFESGAVKEKRISEIGLLIDLIAKYGVELEN